MNKLAQEQISDYYYNLGMNMALDGTVKTAASLKDIAKGVAGVTSHVLPTAGAAAGIAGGGYYGGKVGLDFAELLADVAKAEGDHIGEAATMLLGAPALGAAGLGLGAGLGGLGGYQLGAGAKDAILQALKKQDSKKLFL